MKARPGFHPRPLWAHVVCEVRKLTTKHSRNICLSDCAPPLFLYSPAPSRPSPLLAQAGCSTLLWFLFSGLANVVHAFRRDFWNLLSYFSLKNHKAWRASHCSSVCADTLLMCVFAFSQCKTGIFVPPGRIQVQLASL